MSEKKKYDSTVARIAGNLAGPLIQMHPEGWETPYIAALAVEVARAIVAEVARTESLPPGAAAGAGEDGRTKCTTKS
jgi:hypothetical protein